MRRTAIIPAFDIGVQGALYSRLDGICRDRKTTKPRQSACQPFVPARRRLGVIAEHAADPGAPIALARRADPPDSRPCCRAIMSHPGHRANLCEPDDRGPIAGSRRIRLVIPRSHRSKRTVLVGDGMPVDTGRGSLRLPAGPPSGRPTPRPRRGGSGIRGRSRSGRRTRRWASGRRLAPSPTARAIHPVPHRRHRPRSSVGTIGGASGGRAGADRAPPLDRCGKLGVS